MYEFIYNLANVTTLTDNFIFYNIVSELMFLSLKSKGAFKMIAVDTYIQKITELLKYADLELLDFTFQFLQKSISSSDSLKEDLPSA